MSGIYSESYHECDAMPDKARFLSGNIDMPSMFTLEHIDRAPDGHIVSNDTTTFYGFRYCPYCGERVVDE